MTTAAWYLSSLLCVSAENYHAVSSVDPTPRQQSDAQSSSGQTSVLSDVVVTGELPETSDRIDRRVYVIESDAIAQTSTALEVIARIPSVTVSPSGTVSILGQGSASVLVNGKVPANRNALSTLMGSDVQRVEIMTNPSAEFSAQGTSGIVNVILKRRRTIGLSGSSLFNFDTLGSAKLSVSPAFNNGRWTISTSANAERARSRQQRVRERYYDVPTLDADRRTYNLAQTEITNSLTVGTVYKHSDLTTFDISTSLINTRSNSNSNERVNSKNAPDQIALINAFGTSVYKTAEITADYTTSLISGRFRIDGSMQASRGDLSLTDSYNTTETDNIDAIYSNDSRQIEKQITFSAKSEFDLSAGSVFRSGAELASTHQSSQRSRNFSDDGTILETTARRLTGGQQDIFAAYVTLEAGIGGWTLQPGLRIEHEKFSIESPDAPTSMDRLDYFPSVYFRRKIGNQSTLNLSYSRRINRADLSRRDPFVVFSSPEDAFIGNPNLKPEITDSFEGRLERSRLGTSLGITAYYRSTSDIWRPFNFITPSGVFTQTSINGGEQHNAGIELNYRRAFTPLVKIIVSANGFVSDRLVLDENIELRERVAVATGNATLEYRPLGEDIKSSVFQLSARYSSGERTYQNETNAVAIVDVTWRRPINDRVVSVLSVSDLFDSGDVGTTIFANDFTQRSSISGRGTQVRWSLSYKFGKLH